MPLELNPEIYRAVLDDLPVGVYITDAHRKIAFWNRHAEKLTGYLGQEVIGHFCHDNLLMHCDEKQAPLCQGACPLARTMQDGGARDANIFLRHKDGQRLPVRVRTIPVRDEWGFVIGAAEYFDERSSRASDTRCPHVRRDLTLDKVTEIPDAAAAAAALESALEELAAARSPFGILSISVDDLPALRHTHGCQAVNAIYYAIAQTLSSGTRPDDLVARFSEDRFIAIVLCPSADALRSCAERLQRLVAAVGTPWWGDRISVTVSMGGTMARPADTVASLTARAAQALAETAAQAPHTISVI